MNFYGAANSCSFCCKGEVKVGKVVAGPATLRICNECIELSSSILLEKAVAAVPTFQLTVERSARCSFCGMKSSRVWGMLRGVGHNICSECVELANLIASGNDEQSTNRANVEALQERNKKHWGWRLSWGDFIFTVRWR